MIKILDLALDLLGSFSCMGRSVVNDKILILCDLLIPWERLEEKAAAVGLWAAFAVAAAVADRRMDHGKKWSGKFPAARK